MFDHSSLLPVVAAMLHAAGFILYNINTKKGDSKPNFVSWFIWALLSTMNALTFTAATNWVNALVTFVGATGCIGTFILTLFTGKFKRPDWKDIASLSACLLSIVLWKFLDPVIANAVLFPGLLLSFEPSARGVLYNPLFEKKLLPWWLWTSAYVLTMVNTFLFQGGISFKLVMPLAMTLCHAIVPIICLHLRNKNTPVFELPTMS
ncbi:MAG: hypothetical protein ACM3KM_00365 [Acidobacteriaceae bacterium]